MFLGKSTSDVQSYGKRAQNGASNTRGSSGSTIVVLFMKTSINENNVYHGKYIVFRTSVIKPHTFNKHMEMSERRV